MDKDEQIRKKIDLSTDQRNPKLSSFDEAGCSSDEF